MRIDFHSHILPSIDDGAKSIDESLDLLHMLKNDGVDIVVATPHLYLQEMPIADFLYTRKEAFLRLQYALDSSDEKHPEIVLGAEVYYYDSLADLPLGRLCIEGTDYLLLELPYQNFSANLLNRVADFVSFCDCQVILAHIERYFKFNDIHKIEKLLSLDVLAQFNCDSLLDWSLRRKFWKLLRDGRIHLMGTDAHNTTTRPPRFREAEELLRNKLGDDETDSILLANEMAFKNHPMSSIISLRK